MRTADLVTARRWHYPLGLDDSHHFNEWVSRAVSKSPVLVADNVAAYLDQRGTPNLTDLPSLAPPWESFWIEYPSTSGRQRRGVWVTDTTGADATDGHFKALVDTATRQPLRAGVPKWSVTFVLFAEAGRRKVWGPLGMSMLTLDEQGAVLGHAWSTAPMLDIADAVRRIVDEAPTEQVESPAPLTPDEVRSLTEEQARALHAAAEERETELAAQIRDLDERLGTLQDARSAIYGAIAESGSDDADDTWLTRALAPAYQAVAFLHCKNVSVDEIVPAAKVQARRRRDGKLPLVRYHTLRLDVPRRGGGGGNGDKTASKSLHIVAGHFAHYGACCPSHPPRGLLFGRYEGVYWHPTHARGNSQVGTVRTDFDLRVPG